MLVDVCLAAVLLCDLPHQSAGRLHPDGSEEVCFFLPTLVGKLDQARGQLYMLSFRAGIHPENIQFVVGRPTRVKADPLTKSTTNYFDQLSIVHIRFEVK
jgi:hypothetical protein